MAVRPEPGARLEPLLREHLPAAEDASTAALIRRLAVARDRGYLTASELSAVCYWKSPRAIHHVRANSPARVRAATRAALATRDEERRLEALLELRGVGVPMASAVLTLLYPARYGVIDIRVWQLLHATGRVTANPGGAGFTHGNWAQFLGIVRDLASELGVTARAVDRALFLAHRSYQEGNLYRR